MRSFTLALALLAAASLAFLGSAEPASAQETDIVGDWTLDRANSDNLRDAMARSRRGGQARTDPSRGGEQGRRGGATGGRSGGGQRGGARGQAGNRRTPNQGDRLLQQRLMRPLLDLSITKTDSSYVFSTEGERFAEHFFDGRKLKSSLGSELEVEVKAEWKKNKLEVETKVSGGGKLKEKYEIDKDTGVLKVELELNNSRLGQKVKLKQVYNPAANE